MHSCSRAFEPNGIVQGIRNIKDDDFDHRLHSSARSAITYLGRHDLAQVEPEDLRGDALHRDPDDQDFEKEQVVEERIVEPKPIPKAFMTPRTEHLQPLTENGNGHKNGNGNGHGNSGTAVLPNTFSCGLAQSALKGYEGASLSGVCGQLTLARSGRLQQSATPAARPLVAS